MQRTARLINVFAFLALFFDYAVAMLPPEAGGTRRLLQIYSKQLPTGATAGFKALPDARFVDLGRA